MTGSEGSWTVRLGGPEYLLGQCGFPRYNVRSVRTVLNEASEGGYYVCIYTKQRRISLFMYRRAITVC